MFLSHLDFGFELMGVQCRLVQGSFTLIELGVQGLALGNGSLQSCDLRVEEVSSGLVDGIFHLDLFFGQADLRQHTFIVHKLHKPYKHTQLTQPARLTIFDIWVILDQLLREHILSLRVHNRFSVVLAGDLSQVAGRFTFGRSKLRAPLHLRILHKTVLIRIRDVSI